MAGTLKVKIGIILFSTLIITLKYLVDNAFYQEDTVKRWSELTWDDFQGFVKPFTSYGAGINSGVYIEFDSVSHSYKAFAAQFSHHSWVKDDQRENDYLLNHEQYHFNISEFHARKMNQFIQDNPDKHYYEYLNMLYQIRNELNRMQRKYDRESDHSLIVDKQRMWEYRIDSLLVEFEPGSGFVTDDLSGATAFFSKTPKFQKGVSNYMAYRIHYLKKYNMELGLYSYQIQNFSKNNFYNNLRITYDQDSLEVLSIKIDSTEEVHRADIHAHDTIHSEYQYHRWIYENNCVYKLSATIPTDYGKTDGFEKIARSFISSYKNINRKDFWIDRTDTIPIQTAHNILPRKQINSNVPSDCFTIKVDKIYGFYSGPYRKDDEFILVYDVMERADSLLHENLVMIDNNLFIGESTKETQIFKIPIKNLPSLPFEINFGYTLKSDSINKCYTFYSQYIYLAD